VKSSKPTAVGYGFPRPQDALTIEFYLIIKKYALGWTWWCTSIIPWRWGQEDLKFEASRGKDRETLSQK
jgi:hypothetical protein